MSSTNRSRVKAGKFLLAFALAVLPALAQPCGVRAATIAGSDTWFAGTQLTFDKAELRDGELAIANDDTGLRRFLGKLGATLAYQPGQKYAIVTTADRSTIVFTLGDPRYTANGVAATAPFAPYVEQGSAYFPFMTLARALAVDPVVVGTTTVLEPQISALEVRTENRVTVVTVRGATALHFKRTSDVGADDVTLVFTGIASTLEAERQIGSPGLRAVAIAVGGTPKNPATTMTFSAVPGSVHALTPSASPNVLAIAFSPAGTALGGTPLPAEGTAVVAVAPPPARAPIPSYAQPGGQAAAGPTSTIEDGLVTPVGPAPAAAPATPVPTAYTLPPATITAVTPQVQGDALDVRVALTGNVTYEWHRLGDNRWYVDFKPATLAGAPVDQELDGTAATSLRVKAFMGPNDRLQTVRVALSLTSPRAVALVPSDGGLTIAVDRADDPAPQKVGLGELADGRLVAAVVPLPPPEPASPAGGGGPGWKYTPSAGTNPRLIVIDPGHGGSDFGAMHNGLVEKELNIDVARRLRALLVARGWEVKMTRDADVDVYQPNDSAHDELQARCDVANAAGARLFISVHTNSFTSGDLNGTTTYYYKADSYALADAVHARLAASLPTKDDGVQKENFYVIHHTSMPAILVEMAFLSNPDDAALLRSTAFLQKMALAIADGVGDYAGKTAAPVSSNAGETDGS